MYRHKLDIIRLVLKSVCIAFTQEMHRVKGVCIRSYFGPHFPPHFPAFGLNTERYGVSLRIQSECGKKNADQKNLEYGHFLRSDAKAQILTEITYLSA